MAAPRAERNAPRLDDMASWTNLISGKTDTIRTILATPAECDELVRFCAEHPALSSYATARGIMKLGSSFSDLRRTAARGGISIPEALSSLDGDLVLELMKVNGVIERILGRLVATWYPGVEALHIEGQPAPRLIGRRILNGGGAEPHDDDIAKEFGAESPTAAEVEVQLGFNIYIEIPQAGGALLGWRKRFSEEEYDRHRNREPGLDYGLRREAIGDPDWKVVPRRGEAVIFRNSDIHAIEASEGHRSTLGFFLGYRGSGRPFFVWS